MSTRTLDVTEIACKSLLQKSKWDHTDYSLNPYMGCAFGCSFCYVPTLRKLRGQEWETWGQWAQAKGNALAVFRKELAKIGPEARITIGTATDAWQPIEKRFRITRALLEEMAVRPNPLFLITRSPLLLRDIPLLQQKAAHSPVQVAVSLSTFDERARRVFEPHAPAVRGRERLLSTLASSGLRFTLFWAPLLPGVSDNAEAVEDYLRRAAATGVQRVLCDLLNYKETRSAVYAELLRAYYAATSAQTGAPAAGRPALGRPALAREIMRQADRHGLSCRLGFAELAPGPAVSVS